MKKAISLFLFLLLSVAQSFADTPQDLAQWSNWISAKHPEWRCAKDNNSSLQCVFPGKVSFEIQATGAKFTLQAELLSEGLLPIPGNGELPPFGITVTSADKQTVAAKVVTTNGEIFLSLPAGSFLVSGELIWGTPPSEIPLNGSTGLIEIRNQANSEVLRSASGFRFRERSSETERNSLQIKVFRKFQDSSPLESETVINFRVGGVARPLQLDQITPINSTPISVTSSLNFQLTKQGELSVELSPGEHEVRVKAILAQPISEITVKKPQTPDWPSEEYWVWSPKPELRTVEIIDGKPVSASVINLPKDFDSDTAYAVDGSGLKLKELTRGQNQGVADSLNISRELWLDLDGSGFSVKDSVRGAALSSMRIDAQNELELGRVTQNDAPALVTLSKGAKGVELRDTNVNLQAVSRLPNTRNFSATGWLLDTNDPVSISLHLPPSWELLNVNGGNTYGSSTMSWVESWSLLQIFILSLLVLASYRLFGVQLAVCFFISIILNHAQHLEPKMLFIHLFALFGLQKFFKHLSGLWKTVVSTLALITYVTLALEELSFAKLQFTQFLFPQLPAGTRYRTALQYLFILNEENILVWPGILIILALAIALLRWTFKDLEIWSVIGRMVVSAVVGTFGIAAISGLIAIFAIKESAYSNNEYAKGAPGSYSEEGLSSQSIDNYNGPSSAGGNSAGAVSRFQSIPEKKKMTMAGTNVVAGPSLPNWNWKSAYISVPGPVSKEAQISLLLMPPSVTRIFCGLRAILALLISFFLFRGLGYSLRFAKEKLVLPLAVLALFMPSNARADYPSESMLQELENKIVKEQCQYSPCAQIKELAITIDNSSLKLKLKVSSNGRATFFIPGPLENFSPTTVTVNQRPTALIKRNVNGYLEVMSENGDSTIEVEGLVPSPTFSLQFVTKPLFTKVDLREFAVEGLSKEGTVEQGLRFVKKDVTAQTKLTESVVLPNWTIITREIDISQTISVSTTVTRLGNSSSSYTISVPLLPSEHVTTGVGVASDNALTLTFPPQVSTLSYESLLPFASDLSFTAGDKSQLSEKWIVNCAGYFSCSSGGIQPTSSVTGTVKNTSWYPFPGENVSVHIDQLKTLSGDFVAIDSVQNSVSYSDSLSQGKLVIAARATQQASIKLDVPADVDVEQVLLDGRPTNFSKLEFLQSPGTHQLVVDYTFPISGINSSVPQFTITPPPSNIATTARPNPQRWLIWSQGDGWGPSVLYWSKLLFVIAICLALSYIGAIRISRFSAVFLGIGLTSLPLALCGVPLGWLIWINLSDALISRLTYSKHWVKTGVTATFAIFSFVLLYEVVRIGLVLSPPMLVVGNNSGPENLRWFVDRSTGLLPNAEFLSIPMWAWRGFSLIWSLWLVGALIKWIKQSTAKCLG